MYLFSLNFSCAGSLQGFPLVQAIFNLSPTNIYPGSPPIYRRIALQLTTAICTVLLGSNPGLSFTAIPGAH